ncbi:transposable element Tcb1 transposase [Trichonephila clavipes]|nr:transposable element Tcb1 transposase [Trichonephila clavipes]
MTTEWNNIVFTDETRFCLQHHDDRIRVWRHRVQRLLNCRVMHRHTGPAPGIKIELLPWPVCSTDLSQIQNVWCMLAQRLTRDTLPAAMADQFRQYVDATWAAVPPRIQHPEPL